MTGSDVQRDPSHRAGFRPGRGGVVERLRIVVGTVDPGWSRLRTASTVVAVLVVAVGVLAGLAALTGQPITSALLGVVLAMIASIAVNDPEPGQRAVTTALLVPSAAAAVVLGALLGPYQVVADVAFVAIMIGAVLLRGRGPRGLAVGMVAFIAYFLALFLHVSVAQLPAVLAAIVIGAVVSLLMRVLLAPRHPERELRRMLSALALRAGAVVDVVARAVAEGGFTPAGERRLRNRVARSGEAAALIEERLDSAESPLYALLDDAELEVRVIDFQLGLEHLTAAVGASLREGNGFPTTDRDELAEMLERTRAVLQGAGGCDAADQMRHLVAGLDPGVEDIADPGDDRCAQLRRALQYTVVCWRRIVDPQVDDRADPVVESGVDDEADDGPDPDRFEDARSGGLSDTTRQAVQVGIATALAIVVGELLSPTRWFWAVIAAFVVFVGASTRGQIASKGWQRVLGTVFGVGAGVVVATLVGGNRVLAVLLIMVCLFFAFYLMRVSSGLMIFFITTMLALLYGLLGQFSVGLLVVRLEETAAGAAIGVLVSYLVLPASTRRATGTAVEHFLRDLDELLGQVAVVLTDESGRAAGAADAGPVRESFATLSVAAKPLTGGWAGLTNRSDYRHKLRVLNACVHHARALARLSTAAAGSCAARDRRSVTECAVRSVRDRVGALADAIGEPASARTAPSADPTLDDLRRTAGDTPEPGRSRLVAVTRHLRAIDQAVDELTSTSGGHRGVRTESAARATAESRP